MILISLNLALEKIANEAVKEVPADIKLGLGSGSLAAKFVLALGKTKLDLSNLTIIPSSLQIKLLAEEAGFSRFSSIDGSSSIDLVVDGADQIDTRYNMVKGGGGALLKEKILLYSAKRVIILAEESKYIEALGLDSKIPVEVHPLARKTVSQKLQDIGATSAIRALNKGYPFFTESGNIILDTDLGELRDPAAMELTINNIPGVIEVGIFTRKPNILFKANIDGSFEKIVT